MTGKTVVRNTSSYTIMKTPKLYNEAKPGSLMRSRGLTRLARQGLSGLNFGLIQTKARSRPEFGEPDDVYYTVTDVIVS